MTWYEWLEIEDKQYNEDQIVCPPTVHLRDQLKPKLPESYTNILPTNDLKPEPTNRKPYEIDPTFKETPAGNTLKNINANLLLVSVMNHSMALIQLTYPTNISQLNNVSTIRKW